MFINELIDNEPHSIYVNFEQTRKKFRDKGLVQGSIDMAFRNKVRKSNTIATYNDKKINLLNGMYTNKLGVIKRIINENESVDVTDMERTLIDITVRPVYAGGTMEVLKAFIRAAETVSISKLVNY